MSNSLRDQLLKAGLVTKDQANRAAAKSRRKQKPRKGPESPEAAKQRELAAELARSEQEKRLRDRALNKGRDDERAIKAKRAELRKRLNEARLNAGKGDIVHYFQSGKKVKQVMVNASQQRDLVEGRLGIVVMDGIIHLVDRALADTVQRDDPTARVIVTDETQVEEIDEQYKDYQVPDDLQW